MINIHLLTLIYLIDTYCYIHIYFLKSLKKLFDENVFELLLFYIQKNPFWFRLHFRVNIYKEFRLGYISDSIDNVCETFFRHLFVVILNLIFFNI